jgi:hypothetical protein
MIAGATKTLNVPVRVWAIIGHKNAGKSTIIGHLTSQVGSGANGLRRGRNAAYEEILLRGGGYLYVFARRMAWQEAGIDPPGVETRMKVFARRTQRYSNILPACINVLMALRYDPDNGCPGAKQYLSYFAAAGWSLESLVLLSPTPKQLDYDCFGAPTLYTFDATIDLHHRISWVVGAVRNHFGWA